MMSSLTFPFLRKDSWFIVKTCKLHCSNVQCKERSLQVFFSIFRMLIVFFADKPGQEYEELLDILFLASGLLKPFGQGKIAIKL